MATVTLPPDYFREAVARYDSATNRKAWVRDQLEKANQSLIQYQIELFELVRQAQELGAVFNVNGTVGIQQVKGNATSATTVGAIMAAIPTGYTQVIGGIIIFASSFFRKAEAKQNQDRIQKIMTVANARNLEAQKVGEYQKRYKRELQYLTILPYGLAAVFIWFLYKD